MKISGAGEPMVQNRLPEGSYLFYELKCFYTGENGIEAGGLARQESKSHISNH